MKILIINCLVLVMLMVCSLTEMAAQPVVSTEGCPENYHIGAKEKISTEIISLHILHKKTSKEESDLLAPKSNLAVDLIASPNPVLDELSISWTPSNDVSTISLVDLNGRVLRTWKIENNQSDLLVDMRSFPEGIYFLSLTFEGGERSNHKIVKLKS